MKFFSGPRLAWEAALKKTEVKLELLSDNDMLLIVEKEIRGEICHSIDRLIDMLLIHKFNKGFSFLLCVIDVYSKYAWFILLKDKKILELLRLFKIHR